MLTFMFLFFQYPSIRPVCVDLSNWQETWKAVENIGPIDLLVNNAAIATNDPFLEVTEDVIDQLAVFLYIFCSSIVRESNKLL